jgi:hypothetical protein
MREDRLVAAMSAATPPRDPAFTLAVLHAAENVRYRADRARRVLTGAGFAAAGSSLLMVAATAINADPNDMMLGVGVAVACSVLLMRRRAISGLARRD